jgi:Tol biopolymer transport system component
MNINPTLRGRLTVVARGEVSSPAVSADGSVVVYNEHRDGVTSVYRHEDGESVKLTTDDHPSMHADVNADGSKVVFTRFSDPVPKNPGSWDIALWDESTGQTNMVSEDYGNEMSPRISDDGRTIVWDDDVDRWLGGENIVKSVDGQVEHVTQGPSSDLVPDISGDGSRIVWRRDEGGKSDFWLQDQNGTVKPYLNSEGGVIAASQTYDGQQMAYVDQTSDEEDLYRYDDCTGTRTLVAGVENVTETWPSLSGNGEAVAWTGFDFRKGAPADTNIYLHKDGKTVQATTHQDGLHYSPQLSHDGKTMVWTWMHDDDTSNRLIYKLELES